MTESSDKDSKKVHLIKQTKPTPEQPQEQAAQVSPDHGGEKKKVVVIVKKKVVTAKKVQAKTVEGGTPEGQKDEVKPVMPQPITVEALVDIPVETPQTKAPVSQLKPERQAESPPVAHSKPGAEQGGSSGTAAGHQAHSVTPPPRPSTSSVIAHGSSTAARPNAAFGSQRRYSSDGRAGNLAQGRPGQRYDRGDSRPSPGALAGRAYGTQTGRDFSPGQGRPSSTGPSQYNRGPRPVGGSQYPGSGGAVGKTGYSPGRPGQPVGSRPGGQGGSRVGVGIDGCEAIHDEFRGEKGAFAAAIAGIRAAKAAGNRTGVRFTLNSLNRQDLPAVMELIEQEKIDRFCMYHLVYAGRGSDMKNLDLPTDEKRNVARFLIEKTLDFDRRGSRNRNSHDGQSCRRVVFAGLHRQNESGPGR